MEHIFKESRDPRLILIGSLVDDCREYASASSTHSHLQFANGALQLVHQQPSPVNHLQQDSTNGLN
jgi:hypothetical protein